MSSKIIVELEPREITVLKHGLTVNRHIDDWVIITDVASGDRRVHGYCPLDGDGCHRGTFLPLSGFPVDLVDEVQRQINEIRGYGANGVAPPVMIDSGRTAEEQAKDSADLEAEEHEAEVMSLTERLSDLIDDEDESE